MWVYGVTSFNNQSTRIADVNGDGLPDIIETNNQGGPMETYNVYINTGSTKTESDKGQNGLAKDFQIGESMREDHWQKDQCVLGPLMYAHGFEPCREIDRFGRKSFGYLTYPLSSFDYQL